MPLIIEGSGPVAATLPPVYTLASRLLALPGFVGAYDAAAVATAVGELVGTWPADLGTAGPVTQGTTTYQPVLAEIGGVRVLQWAASKALIGPVAWTPARQGTAGGRFNLTVGVQQYLFGGAATDFTRLDAAGTITTRAGTNLVTSAIASGWHDIIRVQSADTVTVYVDGTPYARARTPVDLPVGLFIGNTPSGVIPTTVGLTGAVQRWFESTAALDAAQIGHVRRFLNSGLR